jgi:hypothetical protein
MVEDFLKLMKTLNSDIQKAQQTSSTGNMIKPMSKHIITKVLKNSDKILKAARKKKKR